MKAIQAAAAIIDVAFGKDVLEKIELVGRTCYKSEDKITLKTEIVMTANAAEWIHFFELRACEKTGKAHPQMLEVTRPLLDEFKETIAVIFDGLSYE